MPFGEVIPECVETISNLKRHVYGKREQVASYNKQKDELKTGEAITHVDCSESYNNTQKDEIQSVYFGQQNFSIFTSCSCYREAEQSDLAKISIAVISESSDLSRIVAFNCSNTIVNELRKRMKDWLKKVILWSDGCSLQFQSKYMFASMIHFDKSVQLEWHYNEVGYGKSVTDSVGRTIKGAVFGLVKSNQITINTAEEFGTEALKGCGVDSLDLPFPRWWDN